MKCTIEFYEKENGRKPVEEFLDALSIKHREKVLHTIYRLKEYGCDMHYPEVDLIKGKKYRGLRELRVEYASDYIRIFFFITKSNVAVLLHSIIKKQAKTPVKDLETALSRMKRYLGGDS